MFKESRNNIIVYPKTATSPDRMADKAWKKAALLILGMKARAAPIKAKLMSQQKVNLSDSMDVISV